MLRRPRWKLTRIQPDPAYLETLPDWHDLPAFVAYLEQIHKTMPEDLKRQPAKPSLEELAESLVSGIFAFNRDDITEETRETLWFMIGTIRRTVIWRYRHEGKKP